MQMQSPAGEEVPTPDAGSDPELRGKLIRWVIILCVGFGDRSRAQFPAG